MWYQKLDEEIRLTGKSRRRRKFIKYKCHCGKVAWADADNINRQNSCGCSKITHGMKNTKLYRRYRSMITRCHCEGHPTWHEYGKKGISVCDRWREDFRNFLEDMGFPPEDHYQIDRIDSRGNYEPNNCRWVTPKENHNNKSSNVRLLTLNDETKSVIEWAKELELNPSTIYKRISKGWKDSDCLRVNKYTHITTTRR